MPDPNSQDTVASQSLTAALLASTPLAKTDKGHLIRSYIHSQSLYLAYFAQEGRKEQSAWKAGAHGIMEEVQPVTADTADAFGTPKLKARVPLSREKKLQDGRWADAVTNSSNIAGACPDDSLKAVSKAVSQQRTHQKARSTVVVPRSPCKERPMSLEPMNTQQRRGPSSDVDMESERERILADRRQRRRAKKAIVDPPPQDEEEDIENATYKRRKKPEKESKRKSKVTNLAAGLALMHGFSATNVGKGRLTLKPSYGVFTKGKASMKTSVKKKKHSTDAWSELEFLGQTDKTEKTSCRRKCRSQSLTSSDIDEKSSGGAPSSLEHGQPRKKFKICNYESDKSGDKTNPRSLLAEETSGGQYCNVQPADASHVGRVSTDKTSLTPRPKSPIWDIETSSHLSDPALEVQDSHISPSDAPTKNGTVVVNTTDRWNLQSVPLLSINKTEDAGEYADDRSHGPDVARSFLSLCPSQSASQLVASRAVHATQARTLDRSRYFKTSSAPQERTSSLSIDRPQELTADAQDSLEPVDLVAEPGRANLTTCPSVGHEDCSGSESNSISPVPEGATTSRRYSGARKATRGAPSSSPILSYLTLDLELDDLGIPPIKAVDTVPHQAQGSFIPASRLPLGDKTWLENCLDFADISAHLSHRNTNTDIVSEGLDRTYGDATSFGHGYEDSLNGLLNEGLQDPDLDSRSRVQLREFWDTISTGQVCVFDLADACSGSSHYTTISNEDPEPDERFVWEQDIQDPESIEIVNEADDFSAPGPIAFEMESSSPPLSTIESAAEFAIEASCPPFPSLSATHLSSSGSVVPADMGNFEGWIFNTGRAITQAPELQFSTVAKVEEDVARGLRDHWLPQRL